MLIGGVTEADFNRTLEIALQLAKDNSIIFDKEKSLGSVE